MYTFVLQNRAYWDMQVVHCGIYATGTIVGRRYE